jgi:hypothetical protein
MPPEEPLRPRNIRLTDLVADPRLLDILTVEEKIGLAAEIFLTEGVTEDPKAKRPNMDPLLADLRRMTTISPLGKVELALDVYINKRVQDQRQPTDPTPPPPGEPPAQPVAVSPPNGDINREQAAQTLAWSAPGGTAYDVYFGTSGPVRRHVQRDQPAVRHHLLLARGSKKRARQQP